MFYLLLTSTCKMPEMWYFSQTPSAPASQGCGVLLAYPSSHTYHLWRQGCGPQAYKLFQPHEINEATTLSRTLTMNTIKQFMGRHSLAINITTNVTLLLLCVVSYAALIALYCSKGMNLRTFTYIEDENTIPPTTAIPLLGVLLTGTTSALITRAVEHSLWISLMRSKGGSRSNPVLTAAESHQRAQWSVSPFARFLYTLNGQSWVLRISGVLLFGTAVLNPILLFGVRPGTESYDTIDAHAPSRPIFTGFVTGIELYSLLDSKRDRFRLNAGMS